MHTFQVTVTRKPGLSDPEGTTTLKALTDLGFVEVDRVSFGRVITITVEDSNSDSARQRVEDMCAKLLANPVMETYEIIDAT